MYFANTRLSVVAIVVTFYLICMLEDLIALQRSMSSSSNSHVFTTEVRKSITTSFPANVFTTSWYLRNAHYQTVIGSGALRSKVFGQPSRPFAVVPEEIHTPDGDSFLVEYSDNINDPTIHGIVIIIHGLESNSRSGLCTNLAIASLAKGFGCCLYNFRGCHGVENK